MLIQKAYYILYIFFIFKGLENENRNEMFPCFDSLSRSSWS